MCSIILRSTNTQLQHLVSQPHHCLSLLLVSVTPGLDDLPDQVHPLVLAGPLRLQLVALLHQPQPAVHRHNPKPCKKKTRDHSTCILPKGGKKDNIGNFLVVVQPIDRQLCKRITKTIPVSERLQHPLLRPERPVGTAGAVEVGPVLGHHDGEPRSAGDGWGPHETSPQPLFVELFGYRDSLMKVVSFSGSFFGYVTCTSQFTLL